MSKVNSISSPITLFDQPSSNEFSAHWKRRVAALFAVVLAAATSTAEAGSGMLTLGMHVCSPLCCTMKVAEPGASVARGSCRCSCT
jgi:hypothetical protein